MTNKKFVAVLVLPTIALLVLTSAMPAFAQANWQHVISASVTPLSSHVTQVSVVAAANIPIHTTILGGFAWFYASGSPNTVFVAVTHTGLRDSNQNPHGWHTHNVALGNPGSNSNACIVSVSPDTTAGLSIHGNTLSVNVRNSELTGQLTDGATAFTIVVDNGCSSGLGVNLS